MMKERFKNQQDDELRALSLERHVRGYIPKGWVEPIHVAVSVPQLSANDFKRFQQWHHEGVLRERLQEVYNRQPYLADAISDYFQRS